MLRNQILLIIYIFSSLNTFTMDSPVKDISSSDCLKLKKYIQQVEDAAELAEKLNATYFPEQANICDSLKDKVKTGENVNDFLVNKLRDIETILNKYSIPHPQRKTLLWLRLLKSELNGLKQKSE